MRFFQSLLCAAALIGATLSTSALAADPKAGVQYLILNPAQPTESGKKVEVTEFFAYYCPHCNAFEPMLEAWVRKQGENIVFKRVHVRRDENVEVQQRLFFTLDALGLVDQYHAKVFAAMHVDKLKLNRDELVFDWAEKAGIDRKKFIDTYRSLGVAARVRRANRMMEDYKIDQWPLVAIDGKYMTSPSYAGAGLPESTTEAQEQQVVLSVMDFLVAKAKAEKK